MLRTRKLVDLESRLFNHAPRAHDVFVNCVRAEQLLGSQEAQQSAVETLNLTESVESLFAREIDATRDLLVELSERAGVDSLSAWVQTTTSKRVMYLSSPAIVRDPMSVSRFRRAGVNNRVHLFQADPIEKSIRLEAISTFARTGARFRYALSIQYVCDTAGARWQLLRPVILLDPWIVDTIASLGERAAEALVRGLRLLGLLVSQGNHDYLHGTMMRWFRPPAIDCPSEYRRLMVERPAPSEMQSWEACAVGRVSGPVSRNGAVPISDPLEFWSLAVHAESVERIAHRQPERLAALHELHALYCEVLQDVVGIRPTPDVRSAAEMLCSVSAFFLALILPDADEVLRPAGAAGDLLDWAVVRSFVAGVHSGLAGVVASLDRRQFVWGGVRMDIHDVLRTYMRDMGLLYRRLVQDQVENGRPADAVRFDLYEELARQHRVA
jgi:hypothetical protein